MKNKSKVTDFHTVRLKKKRNQIYTIYVGAYVDKRDRDNVIKHIVPKQFKHEQVDEECK